MAKKGLVIYAVQGVMEWNAIIPVGAGCINVPFRYGSFTGLGTSSAEYKTSDPFFQRMIEGSDYFQNGKIYIKSDFREEEKSETSEISIETAEEPKTELKQVEMASLEDAKQYLIDEFGFTASALKSKVKIVHAAKANGIVFVGIPDLE